MEYDALYLTPMYLFLQSSLASVHISLCHQATYSKLEVVINEAKNLPKAGLGGSPGESYIVLSNDFRTNFANLEFMKTATVTLLDKSWKTFGAEIFFKPQSNK